MTLIVSAASAFDSRLAAFECLKAYFYGHPQIRKHFLRRAKEGHESGADETANALTTVLQPLDGHSSGDPYRYWFASVIIFHVIFDDSAAKSFAMSITEGDAANGEEVVTCIQTITANLITGIQRNADERILVGYLMLLCGWLFEAPDAVNDFLGETSNVQSLLAAIQSSNSSIVPGLCGVLLGIVYEFSTKDSPLPRSSLHSLLISSRDQYIDRITKLRHHPLFRDFDVLPQKLSSAPVGGLPEVFFDKEFVDFTKDNFSRMIRAIDRLPGIEVPVGIPEGISREIVDSLRSQLEQAQSEHHSTKEALAMMKAINKSLQENLE